MLPTDAMNLVMIMEHAARFGMAAQVANLAPLRDYATSLLKGNRPSQDCSGKVISNTRFVVLEPGQVKPEVLEVVQQALLDDASIEAFYLKRGASEPRTLHIKSSHWDFPTKTPISTSYVFSKACPKANWHPFPCIVFSLPRLHGKT